MRHIVGLSGGKDSTALALRLAEIEPRDYTYICTPTGNEPPEMIAHWQRLECLLGKKIIHLTNETLLYWIDKQQALPSNVMRWCTRKLKIEPTIQYIRAHSPALLYVGLRADEEERKGIYSNDVESRFPMREWGWVLADVWGYLNERGVKIPARTGCEWCFGQRLSEWFLLWRDRPASYSAAVGKELQIGHTFRNPKRDNQPTSLTDLAAKFAAGYIPHGVDDQLDLFDQQQFGVCRECSL